MAKHDANHLKVGIYMRVSTDQQTTKLQKADIEKELKREGIKPVDTYEDLAISGRTETRVQLDRMIADAGKDKFEEIWIWRMDRLARSVRNGLNILNDIEKHGIKVRVLTQPLLNTGAQLSEMIRPLVLWAAQQEWESINLRNKVGKFAWLRQNKWANPPNSPYGYKLTKDYQLEIVPAQARVIKRIYQMYCYDNKSTRDIATVFNQEKIMPPSLAARWNKVVKNPHWRKDAIAKYLKNTVYIGYVDIKWTDEDKENKDKKVRGKPNRTIIHRFICPPIIDVPTYQLAQEKKKERSTLSRRNLKRVYLLRGIIMCAGCSLPLFPKTSIDRYKKCLGCGAKALVRKTGLKIVTRKDRCEKHEWSVTEKEEYISYGYGRNILWDGKAEKRCGRSCGSISEFRVVNAISKWFKVFSIEPRSLDKKSVRVIGIGQVSLFSHDWEKIIDKDFEDTEPKEDVSVLIDETKAELDELALQEARYKEMYGMGRYSRQQLDGKLSEIDIATNGLQDKIIELQQKQLTKDQKKEYKKILLKKLTSLNDLRKLIDKGGESIETDYKIVKELIQRGIISKIYVDFKNDNLKIKTILGDEVEVLRSSAHQRNK